MLFAKSQMRTLAFKIRDLVILSFEICKECEILKNLNISYSNIYYYYMSLGIRKEKRYF